MATEYFPSGEAQLSDWGFNFTTEVPAVVTAVGLAATVDDAAIAARAAFSLALAAQDAAIADAQVATSAKDAAKATFVTELRKLVTLLRAQPLFTDAHALQLGLPVYDDVLTANVMTPPLAQEVPILSINADGRLHHVVDFRPAAGTGAGKPKWARACHIRYAIVAVGQPAPPPDQMQFLASDTRTPYAWDIPAEHAGKDAWYVGAWENPSGERANWSDPAKATVRS